MSKLPESQGNTQGQKVNQPQERHRFMHHLCSVRQHYIKSSSSSMSNVSSIEAIEFLNVYYTENCDYVQVGYAEAQFIKLDARVSLVKI